MQNPNASASGPQTHASQKRGSALDAGGAARTSAALPSPRMSANKAAWERPRDDRGRFVARMPPTQSAVLVRVPMNAPNTITPAPAEGSKAPRPQRTAPAAPASDLMPVTKAVDSLTLAQAARAEASAKNQGKDSAAAARAACLDRAADRAARATARAAACSRNSRGYSVGHPCRTWAILTRSIRPLKPRTKWARCSAGPIGTLGKLGKSLAGRFGAKDGAMP
ncbi:hypothetical protein CIC12_03575 [Burkholderia sp. SG-MS1]|nr:hypothetical protein [Paraburkholderia sp. SG-MS1]